MPAHVKARETGDSSLVISSAVVVSISPTEARTEDCRTISWNGQQAPLVENAVR